MKTTLIKYIIALLASQPAPYTLEAQRLFENNAVGYIIGKNSHPHITLCQFHADEETIGKIQKELKDLKKFPQPHFTGLSFVKDPQPNLWWAELSVSRDSGFIEFQKKIVEILKNHQLSCINAIGDTYRPHLTFARINSLTLDTFNNDVLKDAPFALALGKADEMGQFIEVIEVINTK